MLYRVSAQYGRGGETFIAEFSMREDASHFIGMKRERDHQMKVQVIYKLYEGMDVLDTFNDEDGGTGRVAAPASGSATAAGTGERFSPSPFNTAPRPVGMPQNWKPAEKDEKERK